MKKWFSVLLLICLLMLTTFAAAEFEGSAVASGEDMTDVITLSTDGLEPVTAEDLNDGTYAVDIDVSSSMFKVTDCEITVADGTLTARLYMKSSSYSAMFAGSAEEAAAAPESELLPLETSGDGRPYFDLPVSALNTLITCAAYSARKELWYPRTIVLRSASLPLSAFRADLITAESLGLEDGTYTCAVSMSGSGRATAVSPAVLSVSGGSCTAEVQFSTKKIDYILIDGEKREPLRTEDGAVFEIPVTAFSRPLPLMVDSTAIKPSVEVDYTLTFDESSLVPAE